jgi:hypothetical protein
MALISCPDCDTQISDAAPTCPRCGRPMTDTPVLIEQTGKSYKAGIVIGIIVAVFGFFSAGVVGGAFGLAVLVIGILIFIGSLIAAWWNHG